MEVAVGDKRGRDVGGDSAGVTLATTRKLSVCGFDNQHHIIMLHNIGSIAHSEKHDPGGLGDALKYQWVSVLGLTETWVKGGKRSAGDPTFVADDLSALAEISNFSYRKWSCDVDKRQGGTMVALRDGVEKPQYVVYSLTAAIAEVLGLQPHEADFESHTAGGRVIALGYPGFLLLFLYCILGSSDARVQQTRQDFDEELLDLARQCHAKGVDLLVLGDLNVAPRKADVSLLARTDKKFPPFFNMRFRDTERRQFERLLREGDLVDAWRELHPEPV